MHWLRCTLVEVTLYLRHTYQEMTWADGWSPQDVNNVVIGKLKGKVNILVRMSDSMSIRYCTIVVFTRTSTILNKRMLSHLIVPGRHLEVGPGRVIAAFIIKVLHAVGLGQQ